MASIGSDLISFSFHFGQLWKHHVLTDTNGKFIYNNFYGIQYDQIIELLSNQDLSKMKNYNALALHTNNNKYNSVNPDYSWEVEEIIIEPSEHYPLGMKSKIVAGKFENKEGVLYSEFLGDINTPGATSEIDGLINGRKLCGEVITLRLKNKSPNYVNLSCVTVKFVPSEYSY